MLTTEKFFESAKKAGMTVLASWVPSGGGAQSDADVKFHAPTQDVLQGEAFATDYAITYPATKLVGLKRGETINVGGDVYKVREDPRSELDGTRMRAFLTTS